MKVKKLSKTTKLPYYFKQILWFDDLAKVDLSKDFKTIVFQTLEKKEEWSTSII